MSKTVTLRLPDSVYLKFKTLADQDNRPISNFIENATLKYIEQMIEYCDDIEMAEISADSDLQKRLKVGISEAKKMKGSFVGKL